MSYRILCCYSTNYLRLLVSPSQTWPNFNPTPSTGTTSYQSVSSPTVGPAYNETKTRSVDGYSETQGEYSVTTRERVCYHTYQSRSPYSLSLSPSTNPTFVAMAESSRLQQMCVSRQSYTSTGNDRQVRKHDTGAGRYLTCRGNINNDGYER